MSDWLLDWAELPGGLMGVTDHQQRTITLDSGLLQAERRCTLAHELEHVDRGPAPADAVLGAREEATIDRIVARRLIRMEALADALAWAHNHHEAADELWVDEPTLRARLHHLADSERDYLRDRLSDRH